MYVIPYFIIKGGCPQVTLVPFGYLVSLVPSWPQACPSGTLMALWPYQYLRALVALGAIFVASLFPCSHANASQILLHVHWREPPASSAAFRLQALNLCLDLGFSGLDPFILAAPLSPGPLPQPHLVPVCSGPLAAVLCTLGQPSGSLTPGQVAHTISALIPLGLCGLGCLLYQPSGFQSLNRGWAAHCLSHRGP